MLSLTKLGLGKFVHTIYVHYRSVNRALTYV